MPRSPKGPLLRYKIKYTYHNRGRLKSTQRMEYVFDEEKKEEAIKYYYWFRAECQKWAIHGVIHSDWILCPMKGKKEGKPIIRG